MLRLALSVLVVCATPAAAQTYRLEGRVVFRERIALPTTAQVQVDLIAHGAGPVVIATSQTTGSGQSPFPFVIEVPRSAFRQAPRHSLSARITIDGRLWFVNAGPTDLSPGPPFAPVDVRVVRAR
jgi:putative lipoprotein